MAERKEDEQPPQPQSQGDIIASAIANMLREQLAPITTLTQEMANFRSYLTAFTEGQESVEGTTRVNPGLISQVDTGFAMRGLIDLELHQDYEHRLRDIDANLDDLYYDMSGKKILVIFNHVVFECDLEPRHGTELDVATLKSQFEDVLKFEVQVHNDLKRAALWDVLTRLRDQDHRDTSCLFFAFLTHGDTGGILCAADGAYEFKSVLEMFENHLTLVNKPRVFFVQACRGNKDDFGTEVADNNDDDDDTDFTFVTNSHADFLVMCSTVEDYGSFRHPDSGSLMIQTLCAVIKEKHQELDFVRMATLVHKKVAYDYNVSYYGGDVEPLKQVPETTFTFTKRLQI